MASAVTHPAIPLALFAILGEGAISAPLAISGVACSILPDIDVLTFRLGLPYGSVFGHRGVTHSIAFAALVALIAACFSRQLRARAWVTFAFAFVSMGSHGVLDALTDGGLGVAFFTPMSNARYFLPWRVIRVSPLSPLRFFSSWGAAVLVSELRYVWLPCIGIAIIGYLIRRGAARLTH